MWRTYDCGHTKHLIFKLPCLEFITGYYGEGLYKYDFN
jgi:hypothetical protein